MGFSSESVAAFIAVLGLLSIVAQVCFNYSSFILSILEDSYLLSVCVYAFSSSDCSVKFTDAFHREQEHDPAGFGLPDPPAGVVRVWFRAVVSVRAGPCGHVNLQK